MKWILALLVAAFASSVMAQAPPVAAAQQKLQRLGFYDGTVDGVMGSQTAAAIRRYQLAEGLNVNGQLDSATLRSLGIAAPRPVGTPVPEYVAIAQIFKGGPYITAPTEVQLGAIREAQRNLKLLGYYQGPINGLPNASLVNALKAWQQSAGFRTTGRFDENTLKGLDIMPD
jgi:peptidoglycan hydrolase-like protein with peptidoglycan-binding domain